MLGYRTVWLFPRVLPSSILPRVALPAFLLSCGSLFYFSLLALVSPPGLKMRSWFKGSSFHPLLLSVYNNFLVTFTSAQDWNIIYINISLFLICVSISDLCPKIWIHRDCHSLGSLTNFSNQKVQNQTLVFSPISPYPTHSPFIHSQIRKWHYYITWLHKML